MRGLLEKSFLEGGGGIVFCGLWFCAVDLLRNVSSGSGGAVLCSVGEGVVRLNCYDIW